MDVPRPPPPKTPAELARDAEQRRVQDAMRARRWRQRRLGYGVVTVSAGIVVPVVGLALAGSVSAGGLWPWLTQVGWLPLLLTALGGTAGALLVFLRGWGVALGMITFGVLFMLLVAVTRAAIIGLLPAMPGLVAFFVATGGLVGHLTTVEEDG
ncbi:MAG TPA: hypothetical protein VHX44_16565 [Planctomycetota bacterium]|jgi:hypothetical protein|nr:hypothetical protein [Planctomycetota bacterium]